MRSAVVTLVVLGLLLVLPALPAYAQIELTEVDPVDGAQLDAPPDVVHLCFSQPVDIKDNTTFAFSYQMPDGRNLGLRIVFQPSGECVDVYPGLPDERPAGEYRLEWQVTAAEGGEEGSGTLRFEVTAASTAASASPTPAETPLHVTPSPEANGEAGEAGGGGGPGILFLALIAIGSAGGVAVLFTLGYVVRRRLGYEPHRPPEDDGQGEGQ